VVEKRLKHKIQNTSVQTICRNTRPSGTKLLHNSNYVKTEFVEWLR